LILLAWRLALRDLRGGKSGLVIVLLCLGIGVAAIAGIGSLRAALNQGITESSRGILGGDLSLTTGLGPFPPAVPAWFARHGARVTQTVDTRSILIAPDGRRLLAAVRAVGPGWPMVGAVLSDPANRFPLLARGADGQPGLLLDSNAAASLGLRPGDMVSLGGVKLVFRGGILDSPDRLGDSQLFGVKTFAPLAALAGTPLLQPTGLVTFSLQILLDPGISEPALIAAFHHDYPGNGWRLRTAQDAAPDLTRFIGQMGLFMTLLGLAALLVGGIGVANGVEAWLAGRARSIATLRCLGAASRLLWLIHGMQLLALGVPAILLGAGLGAAAPMLVLPLLRGKLPVPAHLSLYPHALFLAAGFGLLVGLVFALPPLRRAAAISGAALFRGAGLPARVPFSWRAALIQLLAVAALVALAILSVPDRFLALGFCVGAILTLLLLRGVASLLMRGLHYVRPPRDAAFTLALRRLRGPASPLPLMMLSLGAGLTVLVAVAEIRGNLLDEFSGAIPAAAPNFFFIDIQPDQLPQFESALAGTHAVIDVKTLPSLRARILAIAGTPAEQFHPPSRSAWPLNSDLGFTFAAAPPPGAVLAQGAWWPPNYLGPPLVSFDARMAKDWGVKIGDILTVDVLGRKFNLKIANLRQINWQSLQLNFLMIGTPDPFAGAPYSLVATVKCMPTHEADVLTAVTNALPGVTGIDVGQVLKALSGLLREIGTAVNGMGLVALLAGVLVLVSAIAAERESRIAEAVVLKTLGASSAQIRRTWLTEFAIAGGIAGLVAALLGTLAAALTITQVFHTDWHFQPAVMLGTLFGSMALMLIFGSLSTARALREPAAARLRQETGG
jgi:putative ABC transport system permease protein